MSSPCGEETGEGGREHKLWAGGLACPVRCQDYLTGDAAEWIVFNQLFDRRVVAADRVRQKSCAEIVEVLRLPSRTR